MSTNYYIMMDGQVFGPYSYNEVLNLGILSDTMLCTEDSDSQWKPARDYAEFRNLFIFSQPQRPQNVSQHGDTEVNTASTTDSVENSRRSPDIEFAPIDTEEQDDVEDVDVDEDNDNDEVPIENYQRLLFYKQKRKAALKAERLEALNKSIEGKNINLIEKLIYNLKKIKINLI